MPPQESLLITVRGDRLSGVLAAVAKLGLAPRSLRCAVTARGPTVEFYIEGGHAVVQALTDAGFDADAQPHRNAAPATDWVLTAFSADPQSLGDALTTVEANGWQVRSIVALSADPVYEIMLSAHKASDAVAARTALRALGEARGLDFVLQRDGPTRRQKRLVVLDVDSTLIQQEVIDELARAAGAYDDVAAITARAMNGELSFEASLRARVAALKGVPATTFQDVLARIELTPGVLTLIRTVQRLGGRVAAISGGFIQVVRPLADRLGLDYAFANTLAVVDGKLTGELEGPIVDRARKADLVESIALAERIALDQVVAIGDGANDLDMLARAGLGVAFHAKPAVQAQAPCSLNQPGLDAVLYLFGLRASEIAAL